MNLLKLKDEQYLGNKSQELVTHPAYIAAIARLRARLFEQFGRTGLFQRRKREGLWHRIQLLDDFEQELELMIRDGYLASQDLEQNSLKSVK